MTEVPSHYSSVRYWKSKQVSERLPGGKHGQTQPDSLTANTRVVKVTGLSVKKSREEGVSNLKRLEGKV